MTAQTTPIRVDGPHTFILRRGKAPRPGRRYWSPRKDEQLASFGGISRTAFPVFGIVSAAPDHVASDPCQQREGDPVIPRFDESAHKIKPKAHPITGIRNWKKPNVSRERKKCGVTRLRAQPAQTIYGESIHGQCNGNGERT